MQGGTYEDRKAENRGRLGGAGEADWRAWKRMTHLSLFSGIGGLDLAAEWAGFRTAGQCELADYQTKVLEKHWPEVPRWRDIRTLTKESFYDRTGLRTVDVISGGFPCQPFSIAGKRRGCEDDRYLWPELLRIVQEIRPTWVVGENVSGLVRNALDEILDDLEKEGYAVRAYAVKACEVGALFAGERIAIVAASNDRSTVMRGNAQFSADGSAEERGYCESTREEAEAVLKKREDADNETN